MDDETPGEKLESHASQSSSGSKLGVKNDSFNVPVKKNVLIIYGLLNIGLVIFMVILLYVLYQSRQN